MRRVAILAVERCQSLDVIGPLEVFHGANAALERAKRRGGYAPFVVGVTRGPIRTESGLRLVPDTTLARLCAANAPPVDTLILAGGPGVSLALQRPKIVAAIRRCAARAKRTASVCTGAFLLASAGLLDGRRATTHWAHADALERLFTQVRVDRHAIYVRDASTWTAAGVVAGIDLALAMVAEDHGAKIAADVARWLVVFIRRTGAQAQISAQLAAEATERPDLHDLLAWISEHVELDLSLPMLAKRAAMSVRNFARVFRDETGKTPARYVEEVRIESAQRLLDTKKSIDQIAEATGFANAAALRRAFQRKVGLSPAAYRMRSSAGKYPCRRKR